MVRPNHTHLCTVSACFDCRGNGFSGKPCACLVSFAGGGVCARGVDVADPGVNVRMMDKIFRLCDARSTTHNFSVFVSMVEIYNDEVRVQRSCRRQLGGVSVLDRKPYQ